MLLPLGKLPAVVSQSSVHGFRHSFAALENKAVLANAPEHSGGSGTSAALTNVVVYRSFLHQYKNESEERTDLIAERYVGGFARKTMSSQV